MKEQVNDPYVKIK